MPRWTALAGLLFLATMPRAPQAHHSIAHDFDVGQHLRLEGRIVDFHWKNPHCAIRLAVTRIDGRVETWEVESGPLNALSRRGWTRTSLENGKRVVIDAYPARDGSRRANAREIETEDGVHLNAASSYLAPNKR
ncbi:MAG: hypothetical protein RLZZ200_1711 [Pseudomonadota bacterium]|jgi:hypothetical protein